MPSPIELPIDMQQRMNLAQVEAMQKQQAQMQVRLLRVQTAGGLLSKMIDCTSNETDINECVQKATLAADILLQHHGLLRIVEKEEGNGS